MRQSGNRSASKVQLFVRREVLPMAEPILTGYSGHNFFGQLRGLFTHESSREAGPPERGNGPVAWRGLQAHFLERTSEKRASAKPSTKHGIELFASFDSAQDRSVPRFPGSPLDRQSVVSPLSGNNASYRSASGEEIL